MRAGAFSELTPFAAVARLRSFRRAAAELKLRPSTLSHAVSALEARLGVMLLARTTRSVSPTAAGAALLARIAPALATLDDAVEAVNEHRENPQGPVRLTVSQNAATVVLAPMLGTFARTYPDVELEISVNDGFVDIVEAGFDAGIRLGESVGGGMTSVRVSDPFRAAVVASPEYWAAHTPPAAPGDLQRHRCIGRRYGQARAIHRWQFAKDNDRIEVAVTGPLILDAEWLMREAALAGVGVAQLSEHDVVRHMAEGRLVRVLEDWCPPAFAYYLFHPSHRLPSASLRAVVATLQK
ncbi:LysR family transcriptional regulator [Sphingomonas hankookensis]|uniref:LysR family transcriptional regulator n=1 Tax=Sphingomonas hankookensis TaxID=563996 RepID=UPI001F57206E|nr:LysR family transcriptional regulator [Sphingomonas hankookensis]